MIYEKNELYSLDIKKFKDINYKIIFQIMH